MATRKFRRNGPDRDDETAGVAEICKAARRGELDVVPQWKTGTPRGRFPPQIARAEGVRFDAVRPTRLTGEQMRVMKAGICAKM